MENSNALEATISGSSWSNLDDYDLDSADEGETYDPYEDIELQSAIAASITYTRRPTQAQEGRSQALKPSLLSFLDLSAEIRNLVYRNIYPANNQYIVKHHDPRTKIGPEGRTSNPTWHDGVSLALTCHQLYGETRDFLAIPSSDTHHFYIFNHDDRAIFLKMLPRLLSSTRPIGHLKVTLDVPGRHYCVLETLSSALSGNTSITHLDVEFIHPLVPALATFYRFINEINSFARHTGSYTVTGHVGRLACSNVFTLYKTVRGSNGKLSKTWTLEYTALRSDASILEGTHDDLFTALWTGDRAVEAKNDSRGVWL